MLIPSPVLPFVRSFIDHGMYLSMTRLVLPVFFFWVGTADLYFNAAITTYHIDWRLIALPVFRYHGTNCRHHVSRHENSSRVSGINLNVDIPLEIRVLIWMYLIKPEFVENQ